MRSSRLFNLAFFLAAQTSVLSTKLNVTVLGTANDQSRFECWELAASFTSSTQPGVVGTHTTKLGDVSNITYNVAPAGYDSEVHTAPFFQWVLLLSGLGVITLPYDNSTEVVLTPGEAALMFVADTAEFSKEGHGSYFPGVTETVFLQIPAKDNKVPDHSVVYEDKPCTANEYAGLRAWATDA
ncbi:hypothetical protein SLS64_011658 [Diaporthe eres]|uniref:Small secreted protein n=1 Tax=Diaporthe eres TaxID=83184 RepID=A0ABR1P7W5_DIAER